MEGTDRPTPDGATTGIIGGHGTLAGDPELREAPPALPVSRAASWPTLLRPIKIFMLGYTQSQRTCRLWQPVPDSG
jgi:hypothetical protein